MLSVHREEVVHIRCECARCTEKRNCMLILHIFRTFILIRMMKWRNEEIQRTPRTQIIWFPITKNYASKFLMYKSFLFQKTFGEIPVISLEET